MADLAGFSPNAVSWILLGYGILVAIGNIWGGELADKHGAVHCTEIHLRCPGCSADDFPVHGFEVHHAALVTVLVMRGSLPLEMSLGFRFTRCPESRALYAKCGGCGIGAEHCRI